MESTNNLRPNPLSVANTQALMVGLLQQSVRDEAHTLALQFSVLLKNIDGFTTQGELDIIKRWLTKYK